MKILLTLFARTKGGLEQVFIDYSEALIRQGHEVHMAIAPDMPYRDTLEKLGGTLHPIPSQGPWDMFSAWKLNRLAKTLNPDLIIGHGNRSLDLLTGPLAPNSPAPVMAVAQNYKLKRFPRCDGAFTSTLALRDLLMQNGMSPDSLIHIPNMVRLPDSRWIAKRQNIPPVIGTIARFVTKKGMEVYIDALGILKEEGHTFKAIIAGDGELRSALEARADALGLTEQLEFVGWVEDKDHFYSKLDIFAFPSLHEPFGIVGLEAMSYGLPMVSSASEGPSEYLTHEEDALMVPIGDATALAESLARLLKDRTLADTLAKNARQTIEQTYALDAVGERLSDACESISRYKHQAA